MTISWTKRLAAKITGMILSVFFCSFNLWAEYFSSQQYGYTIDFPEAFALNSDPSDEASCLFTHTILPVQAVLRVWPATTYKNADTALSGTFAKLNASANDINTVKWRNEDCVLSQFSMQNAGVSQKMAGWACAAPLPEKKAVIVLLVYTTEDKEYDCEQFILSLIDSLMIDHGSSRESGIVTAYAFPGSETKDISLTINGEKIATKINKEDSEAEQFVIDREFAVFKLYVQTPYWKEAWQRFYRQIARDGYSRLKKVSFDIYAALYADAKQKDPANPDAAIAQMLLTWAQSFPYGQTAATNPDRADFTTLPSILEGKKSDCDSRSMLLAVLLKDMDMNTCIFVSREYSHAMLGIELKGKQGQTIKAGSTDFLVGETIDKNLTIGMMRASMQDKTNWIPVELP